MTQLSWPWTCTATGDGGTTSFTMDVVQFTSMLLLNANPTGAGVIYWNDSTPLSTIANVTPFSTMTGTIDGLLLPSNPSGNTVRIASGLGLVDGWLYANDANVDFDVSGGEASATDIIVLRRDRSAQTVRLALVRGPAAGTATVTQTSSTWEVKLCDVTLDGSGNFSSLTDARHFCISPLAGMVKIRETEGDGTTGNITFDNIQQDFTSLLITGQLRADNVNATVQLKVYFNGEKAGTNYNNFGFYLEKATAFTNPTYSSATVGFQLLSDSAGAQANTFGYFEFKLFNYSDNSNYTTVKGCSLVEGNNTGVYPRKDIAEGWWSNTDAVTKIEIVIAGAGSGNYVPGSKLSLYGIR